MATETDCERYERIVSEIDKYYDEAKRTMDLSEKLLDSLPRIITKLNYRLSQLEYFVMNLHSGSNDSLSSALKEQHVKKAKFDAVATEWLKVHDVPVKNIRSVLLVPRTLRSVKDSGSTTSSVIMAQAIAKQAVARLRLLRLEKQHKLEREEAERKQKLEREEAERKQVLEREEAAFKQKQDRRS